MLKDITIKLFTTCVIGPSKSNSKARVGMEATMAAQYVKQKLEMGRARVWNDVQAKVAALVMGCEPADFKFEDFLQVLDLVDR
jgi:hypothetical protein